MRIFDSAASDSEGDAVPLQVGLRSTNNTDNVLDTVSLLWFFQVR